MSKTTETAVSTVVVLTASRIGYGVWGQGKDRAEAVKKARSNGGRPDVRGMTVLTFGPSSTFDGVDQMGRVHWHGPAPEVEEVAAR